MSKLLKNYLSPPAFSFRENAIKKARASQLTSSLVDVCKLMGIPPLPAPLADSLTFNHVQIKPGQVIYSTGQPFTTLYIVYSGFIKTTLDAAAEDEQILDFPMKGDLLGTDGIHRKHYTSNAIALSHCNLVMIPFDVLMEIGKRSSELEVGIYSIMSRELIHKQRMLKVVGSLSAEERVAHFLTALSARFSALGYSDKEFKLRMTRREIASYLGLSLETVSRIIAALDRSGLVAVDGRSITINDSYRLKTLRRLPQVNVSKNVFANNSHNESYTAPVA